MSETLAIHTNGAASTAEAPPHSALALVLDQIDHGLILVDPQGRVWHANRVARAELNDPEHAMQFHEGCLRARRASDAQKLREALSAAHTKRLRCLLMLEADHQATSVAVVPLPCSHGETPVTLLMLGKRSARTSLATYWFARSCGLTAAEVQVLHALCGGVSPRDIASDHSVAVSTIRTQISSIRSKTRSTSLRELIRRVAHLPPIAPTVPTAR